MFAKYMRKRKIFASILILPILVILLHSIIPHHHHEHESICEQQNSHYHISDYILHNDLSQIDIKTNSHEDNHICRFTVDILLRHQNSASWIPSSFLYSEIINTYFPKYSFSEEFPEIIFIEEQKAFLSSESLRAPPFVA